MGLVFVVWRGKVPAERWVCEEGREGGGEGGKVGGREGRLEGGREGWREGGKVGGREQGREGGNINILHSSYKENFPCK